MESIFSTKERIKILKAVIFSEQPISVNLIAAKLKISKGLVSKYLDILLKEAEKALESALEFLSSMECLFKAIS